MARGIRGDSGRLGDNHHMMNGTLMMMLRVVLAELFAAVARAIVPDWALSLIGSTDA